MMNEERVMNGVEARNIQVPAHMDVVYVNRDNYKKMLGHGEMDNLPLQYDVQQLQVFDQNTGRRILVDANGRRVVPRREMSGTQLVRINSMRNQVGLKYLSEHNVKSMSIDSASLMIDDLMFFIQRYEELRMNFGTEYKKLEEQNQVLIEQLDNALKDPRVGAEIAKQQQAERARNNK